MGQFILDGLTGISILVVSCILFAIVYGIISDWRNGHRKPAFLFFAALVVWAVSGLIGRLL